MTTQFFQQVPYTFLLRLAPDNSYFILCPREVSLSNNKCMNFYGYGSFSDYNNVMPHFMPPLPIDFNQFGSAWCNESLTAYFNAIGLSSYIKEFHYEGVVFQPNGNNQSAAGVNEALLVGRLEVNNQIDTDFDNLFSNLISTLNTLLTPISQISLSLLGINNVFPTLVSNLSALNENNVPVSIAQILKDKQIDVDMSQTQVSLDDTNLVTQLQNIYTILSSQNANQASISSAITNKDNQSDIVDKLDSIFMENLLNNNSKISVFRHPRGVYNVDVGNVWRTTVNSRLSQLCLLLSSLSSISTASYDGFGTNANKLLNKVDNSLSSIETKLEQNLPFTTNVDNVLVIDGQQEFKIRNKNNDEDFD